VHDALAAIAIGSNVPSPAGDRRATVRSALKSLAILPGTSLVASSSFHETLPVSDIPQDPYINACVLLRTSLTPRELLTHLLRIEFAHGRTRDPAKRWGPRTLDLDVLLYDDSEIDEQGLRIPHPRLHERLFVLEPLSEIMPEAVVPGVRRRVRELLDDLRRAHARPD
jgi:2-amino-4-hydroxy-6-hydroxymethyldihydropteridine diphosphokinase